MTENAAREGTGSAVMLTLSDVRRTYRDLMLHAARSPGATLGQRLYACRHRAELSPEESAAAAGVPVQAILDAEAERPVAADIGASLEALIARMMYR